MKPLRASLASTPTATLSKPFLIATWVKQEYSAELAGQAGLWRRTRIGDL